MPGTGRLNPSEPRKLISEWTRASRSAVTDAELTRPNGNATGPADVEPAAEIGQREGEGDHSDGEPDRGDRTRR